MGLTTMLEKQNKKNKMKQNWITRCSCRTITAVLSRPWGWNICASDVGVASRELTPVSIFRTVVTIVSIRAVAPNNLNKIVTSTTECYTRLIFNS